MYERASDTCLRTDSSTCSRVIRSLCSRCSGLVDRNTCRRGLAAASSARAEVSMSACRQRDSTARLRLGRRSSRPIRAIASRSDCELAGKPVSMMSTPSSSSARAITSFCGGLMLQPGDCSPSRRVVSKMRMRGVVIRSMVVTGKSPRQRVRRLAGGKGKRQGMRGRWPCRASAVVCGCCRCAVAVACAVGADGCR